jgi:hypothetical protein
MAMRKISFFDWIFTLSQPLPEGEETAPGTGSGTAILWSALTSSRVFH